MKKIKLYVCEDLYPEYMYAIEKEGLECFDVNVRPYVCENTGNALLDISCFSHFLCGEFLEYIAKDGGYILTWGWLKNRREKLFSITFNKETVKRLVFIDAGIDETAESILKELSVHTGLPYIVLNTELNELSDFLRNTAEKYKSDLEKEQNTALINELSSQCAEYSAILDMVGKISSYLSKRDIVDKIKELFTIVFGAQHFKFYGSSSISNEEEYYYKMLKEDEFLLFKEENRFLLKVCWDGKIYGIIDASGFLFPGYIEKYLNLAIEISRFSGLVFHNSEQYEKIIESERELKYLSFRDAMTGLFNRAYINQIFPESVKNKKIVVFMFDIDRLKYVNDNYGHAEGDELIIRFAQIIGKCFREKDIVARIGGDEFVAVLYDADEKTAELIETRIVKAIESYNNDLDKKHLSLSVSAGYYTTDNEASTIEDLVKKADRHMYKDKARKKFN